MGRLLLPLTGTDWDARVPAGVSMRQVETARILAFNRDRAALTEPCSGKTRRHSASQGW
jgi:hypothetical protein